MTVAGYCPMGCGSTLFVAAGGYVTCSYPPCPRPDAVADLLADRETGHVVRIGPDEFTVRHPLRERLGDELMRCRLHTEIAASDGPPVVPGRYRVTQAGDRWVWQRLPGEVG